jgi:hypothetical protein
MLFKQWTDVAVAFCLQLAFRRTVRQLALAAAGDFDSRPSVAAVRVSYIRAE